MALVNPTGDILQDISPYHFASFGIGLTIGLAVTGAATYVS